MRSSKEQKLAFCLLFAVLLANMAGLWPELTVSRVDLNDNALHYPLIKGMVEAFEHGRNPFDWWAPEWALGYPVLRTYQPLGHLIVTLLYFALFKTVSLMTVFTWVRFLSVALLPLSFYACARMLRFSPLTAAAAALLAPMISTPALYGLEYGSYLWAGSGLFTQAIAQHFLLLTIGVGFNSIRHGRRLALTGALMGLTFLAHFIYGYIAGLTLCLICFMPDRETPRWTRVVRTAWIGAVAFVLIAFELLPMLLDGGLINRSRWEAAWKWDSFGAAQVSKWLFTGELLDHGRLPILTLLSLGGLVWYFVDLKRSGRRYPARTFVALGALLWILVFFGRPFWGPMLSMIAVVSSLQLHRVIGGAHVFLVLLAAIGLAGLWRLLTKKFHWAAAAAVTALLFYPMVKERATYLTNNETWGERSLGAYNINRDSIDAALRLAHDRGGRAYAGLAATWGASFRIGDPQFYAYMSEASQPALSFLYHSMSLPSEIMTRFNEGNAFHYRLFNINTVIEPQQNQPALPGFLNPIADTPAMRVLAAPGGGYFDVVDAFYAVRTTHDNFYDVNDRWLQSDWVANKQHLLLDWTGDARPSAGRLSPDDNLPAAPSIPFAGFVHNEQDDRQDYQADIEITRPSFVLFKMSWHPNWKSLIDGKAVSTVMLSPGFLGVPVTPGHHRIELHYKPGLWKTLLALFGFITVTLLVIREPVGAEFSLAIPQFAMRRPVLTGAGLLVLALPVCIPLLTSRLLDGHDALVYLPRLVEFDQNIRHGIWFPQWAPDLGQGAGEPALLFLPPVMHYIAEAFHLAGFNFLASINLTCVVLALAAATGMYLLGRLYFGEIGGWIAAAAMLYAPYFALDLYVRAALAESGAFAFIAFTLYGFGAFAKNKERKYLLLGAVAYGAVLLSHNPTALLFTPLLLTFLCFTAWRARSWSVLFQDALGVILGLGLAACVWLPSLAEKQYTLSSLLTEGYLHYTNHFVYFHQLFDSPWGFGLSLPGDQDGMSFSLGWNYWVLAAIALISIFLRRPARERAFFDYWIFVFFAAATVAVCWFMLNQSMFIWDRIPLLQFVQFPWRLLGEATICLSIVVASLGGVTWLAPRYRAAALTVVFALLIVPDLPHLAPKQYRDLDLALWSPAQISGRAVGIGTMDEYRPRWMQYTSRIDPYTATLVTGNGDIRQTGITPVSWKGVIQAKTPGVVELAVAYFPGWRVKVDDLFVSPFPSPGTGHIQFPVAAGEHRIQADFTGTLISHIAEAISVISVLIALIALGMSYKPTTPAVTTDLREAAHVA